MGSDNGCSYCKKLKVFVAQGQRGVFYLAREKKEKKQQTDHAELLTVLAVKLNSYVDALSKSKNY